MRFTRLNHSGAIVKLSRGQFAAWCAVVLFLLGLMIVLAGLPVESSDYGDFHLAAVHLLRGENAYALETNGAQGFFNPLWAAFPFVPLTAFDPPIAFQVWRLIVIAILVATIYPVARLYHVQIDPIWVALLGWLILLPWFVGQNAPLVAAGVFLVLAFAARENWGRVGAMMPLLAIKPQTVLLFPFALWLRGRRRVFVSATISVGIAIVASWLVQFDWIAALLASRWGESQSAGGQNFPASGILNVLEFLTLPMWLYAFFVLGALGLFWRYRHSDCKQLAALTLGLGTVVAPYIRAGDFPLLIPMLFLLPKRWVNVLTLPLIILFLSRLPVPLLWLIPAIVTGVFVIACERNRIELVRLPR
jgi:hypothetical protein